MVKALVIDEISREMACFFNKLEYIVRTIKEIDELWGGIQLVVSGDFLQLPGECWQSDPKLIRLLQGIRGGDLDTDGLKLLMQGRCSKEPDDMVVRLFARIIDVKQVNNERLKELGEDIIVYETFDKGEKPWID
uniref:ATP-dependent DNA helicase n=1 Tax=Chenopodium quinoa TaxID=63459 RepID=A0A803KQE1_CHEQI